MGRKNQIKFEILKQKLGSCFIKTPLTRVLCFNPTIYGDVRQQYNKVYILLLCEAQNNLEGVSYCRNRKNIE